MSYKKLTSKFPNHKIVRIVSTTRDCPLSLKERWVYSTLLWRYNRKPVSKARLARWTGVDRTRTLPRILVRLRNFRLVVESDKKFKAVLPPTDLMPWFATWIHGLGAQERLMLSNNWAIYDRGRDIIDSLVLAADTLGHHKAAKLAKRFGVCAKTITAARRRLQVATAAPSASVEATQTVLAVIPPVGEKSVHSVTTAPQVVALAPEMSPAQLLAMQFADRLGIEPEATKQIARLCELLKGFARKEINQIIAALVKKYGVGEGLEDAVWFLIQQRYLDYQCGTTMERVMAHIGMGRSADDDDDLSMVGDVELELVEAV
jgi:hypothetical protein